MKIATRNLLAEMLIEALDDHIAASAIHWLVEYDRAMKKTPPAMAVDRLLQSVQEEEHEAVVAKLHTNPLLSWDLRGRSGRVTLSTSFASEWPIIAERLVRFSAALKDWSTTEGKLSLSQALRKGIVLFNHRLFFEVHEVLEAQWTQETGEEKQFLQGLIQIAVAFYHLENRNLRGALLLLQDGTEKITPYRPTFLGIELQEFIRELEACRTELAQLSKKQLLQPRLVSIPTMQLVRA
jgi:predicted metal-dependent hydrolase